MDAVAVGSVAAGFGIVEGIEALFPGVGWLAEVPTGAAEAITLGIVSLASGNAESSGLSLQTLNNGYLKKLGINGHAFKQRVLGKKAPIAEWDIVEDKKTGELYLERKSGANKGTLVSTDENINDYKKDE
ncbi:MAG: hypothetical protein OWT28_00810 [Firmicutes bacterium]|nr:hypothetical protein [Bacillota bacterium]